MGRYLRNNYWVPALRSARLQAGGRPVRVRLFGLNLVAFRGHDGKLGLIDERCPHRGASMALARNEDSALRCIFHGWKLDTSGALVDVPNEPNRPEQIKKNFKPPHYAVREAAGLVWAWVGGEGDPPEFPEFEFMKLSPEHVTVWFQSTRCNWFQALEGAIDSSHVGILHEDKLRNFAAQIQNASVDNAPRFEIESKPYGYEAAAIRLLNDKSQYVRVTQFVAPWMSFIPPADAVADRLVHFTIPVDNTNCLQLILRYNYSKTPGAPKAFADHVDPDAFSPLPGSCAEDVWGQDGESMTSGKSMSGFSTLFCEDLAVQESQGPIADRTRELMCTGDQVIARARRLLLDSVKQYMADESSSAPRKEVINYASIRSRSGVVPAGQEWRNSSAMQVEEKV